MSEQPEPLAKALAPSWAIAIVLGVIAAIVFGAFDAVFGGAYYGWGGTALFGLLIFGFAWWRIEMRRKSVRRAIGGPRD